MSEVGAGVTDLVLGTVLVSCAVRLRWTPGVHRYWALIWWSAGAAAFAGAAHHLVFSHSPGRRPQLGRGRGARRGRAVLPAGRDRDGDAGRALGPAGDPGQDRRPARVCGLDGDCRHRPDRAAGALRERDDGDDRRALVLRPVRRAPGGRPDAGRDRGPRRLGGLLRPAGLDLPDLARPRRPLAAAPGPDPRRAAADPGRRRRRPPDTRPGRAGRGPPPALARF